VAIGLKIGLFLCQEELAAAGGEAWVGGGSHAIDWEVSEEDEVHHWDQ
jgi:hypothetical protein